MIDKSVFGAGVSVSVAKLLPGVGSVCPDPAVTVAVFARSPVAAALTVPLTVMVTKLPLPALILTPVNDTVLPPGLTLVPQTAVPLATQLVVTPVIAAGTVSATLAPMAFVGPALPTTMA